MTMNSRRIVHVVLVASMAVAATVVSAQSGELGTWRLNVANSKFTPGPAPKTSSVTFSAAGQGVKAVIDTLGADGSKVHWEYTANFDGKAYPVTGNPDGDMVVARRINPNSIETSYTLKGKATTVNTRVVSADGKTLTVTTVGTNAQGQKVNNVQVFERG